MSKKRIFAALMVATMFLMSAGFAVMANELGEPTAPMHSSNCEQQMYDDFESFNFIQCECWCGNGWCCTTPNCSHCNVICNCGRFCSDAICQTCRCYG